MFFRARRAFNRAWFDLNCRGLLQTPGLPPADCPLTVVSMLPHGEVLMYLLALKSFVRHLGRTPKVVVLNDGSLTAQDRSTLGAHVTTLEIVPIKSVSTGTCPKGSCWERLALIAELVKDGFIVQLDSDTLTRLPIEEVVQCIDANRSFTLLGDRSHPEVEPMLDACARAKQSTSSLVQAVCERGFDRLPEAKELKYIRGNAGFVGFAQGSISLEKMEWMSDLMRPISEGTWDQWGSEQLASNLLIANTENPYPLPFPRYGSYWAHPDVDYERSAFLHFIGPHRYDHGFYRKSAKQVLRALSK